MLQRGHRAPPMVAMMQMLAVSRHATEDLLHELRVPTLILTGDADRLVPVENAYELAKLIPHAELQIFPGAGHCFPVERELETVAALDAFLTRHA